MEKSKLKWEDLEKNARYDPLEEELEETRKQKISKIKMEKQEKIEQENKKKQQKFKEQRQKQKNKNIQKREKLKNPEIIKKRNRNKKAIEIVSIAFTINK